MSLNTKHYTCEKQKKTEPKVGDIVSVHGGEKNKVGIVVSSFIKSYHYIDPERIPADGDIIMVVMWNDGSCSEQLPFLLKNELAS